MNAHLIIGDDDFLVDEAAREVVGGVDDREEIDSSKSSTAELQLLDVKRARESLFTPPFLSPRKVTWWRNVWFLPGGGEEALEGKKKVSDDVKKALEAFAAAWASFPMPENQAFVLSGPRLLKASVFYKTLAGHVEERFFASGKPWEAAREAERRVAAFAKRLGLQFEGPALSQFVARVGTSSRALVSELGKMRDYLGPGETTIRSKDVAAITCSSGLDETEVWDVTDALGRRDLQATLCALGAFELEKGFAVFMSGVLEKFFRQLLAVKEGRPVALNPYALKKNEAFAANWTLPELREARERFFRLREDVVSGTQAGDVRVVLDVIRAVAGVGRSRQI